MPLVEVLTLKVGNAVVGALVKNWLKDNAIPGQPAASVPDVLLNKAFPDWSERRRKERLLDQVADEVARRLEPIYVNEFKMVPENERQAAAIAVGKTIDTLFPGSAILLQ